MIKIIKRLFVFLIIKGPGLAASTLYNVLFTTLRAQSRRLLDFIMGREDMELLKALASGGVSALRMLELLALRRGMDRSEWNKKECSN